MISSPDNPLPCNDMRNTKQRTGPIQETILICSWLEAENVDQICRLDRRVQVEYHPELLPPPRYPADHTGAPLERSADEQQRWLELLSRATILFDFDRTHLEDLPRLTPQVRWIQATSAGIGQLMRRRRFAQRMPHTVVTTASGVHTRALAEFVAMSMMMHSRRTLDMIRAQAAHHWERFAGSDLEGRSVLIVGLGAIGKAIAGLARALGMTVLGIRRSSVSDASQIAHELHRPEALSDLLPRAEFLVLVVPLTDQTRGMIGVHELARLQPGSALINIGRGALVDESALVQSLQSGHLGGAYLDVFEKEPLPPDSPLWKMPNVLVSPHSGSTSDRENGRLTDLFCENLTRWLEDRPLRNVFDPKRGY